MRGGLSGPIYYIGPLFFFPRIYNTYYLLITQCIYRNYFGHIGSRSRIIKPTLIYNAKNIYIGNRVIIRNGARLETVTERHGMRYSPRVEIGDDTSIEQGFHLACGARIVIGRKVAITEYVAIFDIWHPYEDINAPIVDQPLRTASVEIGDCCLIGAGAKIQPGVKLGRNCAVGANSVVTSSFPAFSIIAGVPARLLRQYSVENGCWRTAPNEFAK